MTPVTAIFNSKAFIAWRLLAGLMLFLVSAAAFPRSPLSLRTVAPGSLRVATRIVPPFVFKDPDSGALTGFSVELWEAITAEMKRKSSMKPYEGMSDLLGAVKKGQADLGIAAISITSDRDKILDFSQPMFDSGLQIMVRKRGGVSEMAGLVEALFSPALLHILAAMMALVLIPAHIIWWVERRHPDGIVVSKAYFPGIFQAIWWAASTLATQAEEMPKSNGGRVIALLWMFFSVVFIAYFTAAVTANLTVQQLHGDIRGPDDLPGKTVATTSGSTSESYLRAHGSHAVGFPQIDGAFDALEKGQADAVVFDAPVLLYFASNAGQGKVAVVGSVFRKEDYGIVFPSNSPYRKPVNLALLTLKENGTYQKLYDKWFGSSEGG